VSNLHLWRESAFDEHILLSVITGCDDLLDFLGRVLLRKLACLSRLPSPLCNGKLAASRAQAIEAERGLLWLCVVTVDFEAKKANSL